jgi:3-hydroxyacyl-CoA dehydrogenase/enoyl-CoA hydratase/3-hydroxybutyryl-CoA epimerase
VAFGKRVEKQVIVVRDCVGFYTSRILAPYISEAAHILAEGGNDVGARVAKIMFEAYGERMKPEEALAGVVKDGRQGRKNKRGF